MPAPATAIFTPIVLFRLFFRAKKNSSSNGGSVKQERASRARSLLRSRRSYWDEQAFANTIVNVAPANASAAETEQPDQQGPGIPQRHERHLLPDTPLLHPPNTD